MKVLFTFGGLPHYYNFVLNRLNDSKDIEVNVLVPLKKSEIIGKGVFQSEAGIKFKIYKLPEYNPWYGREFFRGFSKLYDEVQPDIIVATWPYILGFIFLPSILLKMKLRKTGLILKEIPFGIPRRKEAVEFYTGENIYSENTNKTGYDKGIASNLKIKLLTFIRIIIYNMVDAHVNYISEAYDIFGSYGVNKEKIFITYNSPDTSRLIKAKEELESRGVQPVAHRIIHVGRLVKWKRVDLLIDAVAELKKEFPGIELYILGEGPEKDSLERQAEQLNINDNIHFIGSVYDPVELGNYLMNSSIYVLAGMGGLSINEAMSFGKPVICSVCDGTEKELVRDGYNGFFFKEGDKFDLVDKVRFLLKNPDLKNEMGNNSFNIIKNKININSVLNGYHQAFAYVYKKYNNLILND